MGIEPKSYNPPVPQRGSKPCTVKLNDGRFIPVIDMSETLPPPDGMLKCTNCGRQATHRRDVSYEQQGECPACIPRGLSMKSAGYNGWKRESKLCPKCKGKKIVSACEINESGLPMKSSRMCYNCNGKGTVK